MGVWNIHTSLGNILGALVAGALIDNTWGWAFIVPGCIIAGMGVIVFLFLIECKFILVCNKIVLKIELLKKIHVIPIVVHRSALRKGQN